MDIGNILEGGAEVLNSLLSWVSLPSVNWEAIVAIIVLAFFAWFFFFKKEKIINNTHVDSHNITASGQHSSVNAGNTTNHNYGGIVTVLVLIVGVFWYFYGFQVVNIDKKSSKPSVVNAIPPVPYMGIKVLSGNEILSGVGIKLIRTNENCTLDAEPINFEGQQPLFGGGEYYFKDIQGISGETIKVVVTRDGFTAAARCTRLGEHVEIEMQRNLR